MMDVPRPIDDEIQERVDSFRLALTKHDSRTMVHRFVLGAPCYALSHDSHMLLKETISHHFSIPSMEVNIVGSAKLGFTVAPDKPRYRAFGDESDIDVAIVSPQLFDACWSATFEYARNASFHPWLTQFRKYLYRGWIRPDLWPKTREFNIADDWWEFFRMLSKSSDFGQLQVSAGIYRTWNFLETYHAESIEALRANPTEVLG